MNKFVRLLWKTDMLVFSRFFLYIKETLCIQNLNKNTHTSFTKCLCRFLPMVCRSPFFGMVCQALVANTKYIFVDKTFVVPPITYSHHFAWERCINLVHSWITNSISPSLRECCFPEKCYLVWFDLCFRVSIGNL